MSIDVYINFNGDCRQAVSYYANVFGLEEPKFMTFGDAPTDPSYPISEETKGLIMHANLKINGTNLMFSDVPNGMPFVKGNNISLVINSKNIDEIKSLFNKLKEGGSVKMELQETFWSKCYGYVTDKFGIQWQLSHDSGTMGT
ncbi:MAG: VOC family protein [Bacillota bacterium]|nr:VOC family protein [Bacillota bacterium]